METRRNCVFAQCWQDLSQKSDNNKMYPLWVIKKNTFHAAAMLFSSIKESYTVYGNACNLDFVKSEEKPSCCMATMFLQKGVS
jgi:hypothetical protein